VVYLIETQVHFVVGLRPGVDLAVRPFYSLYWGLGLDMVLVIRPFLGF